MKAIVALLTTCLILALAANGLSQGVQTGIIRGTVVDAQGAVVPGVTVTVTSPALQGPRSTVTDAQGSFSLRNLPAGDYEMTFELSGFRTVKQTSALPLGLTLERNVTVHPADVEIGVTVAAETPAPIATPIVGANFKHDEIEALATPRTLQGIATLSPGLTTNTPNRNQVAINGAFAFDNVFMVNGVDINDNLFGSPQDLFIEDGIEETQVLTSGVPAEYGRFTGGVVNAITKSGGNRFSGSFRTNFSNPQWTVQTPFETCDPAVTTASCRPAPERPDDLQFVYEGTLGGPIVKDKLWFFGAGRYSELSNASTLPISNQPNVQTDTNKRAEIKITGTAKTNHTIQGGYLNSPTDQASRPTFGFTIDPAAVVNPNYPNWYTFVNYRGVFGTKFLGEARYCNQKVPAAGHRRDEHRPGRLSDHHVDPAAGPLQRPVFRFDRSRRPEQFAADRQLHLLPRLGQARPSRDQGRLRMVPEPEHRRQFADGHRLRDLCGLRRRCRRQPAVRRRKPADPDIRAGPDAKRELDSGSRRLNQCGYELFVRPGSLGDQQPLVSGPRRSI